MLTATLSLVWGRECMVGKLLFDVCRPKWDSPCMYRHQNKQQGRQGMDSG